jgi:predicted enzyme related to lactoylglutathione lyase
VAFQGDQCVAGLFPLSSPEFDCVPESWMSFLAVDDVDARVAKAVAAGAKLVMPVFDVPNVGRIAMLLEPSGAGIGWMTPIGPRAQEE